MAISLSKRKKVKESLDRLGISAEELENELETCCKRTTMKIELTICIELFMAKYFDIQKDIAYHNKLLTLGVQFLVF